MQEKVAENADNMTWMATGQKVEASGEDVIFRPAEIIPIMADGVVMGYLSINWVQKLGIWDYNNEAAVIAGIRESYTINMHVDFKDNISSAEMKMVNIEPVLLNKNLEQVGTPCIVGWSGFSNNAQLYDNNKEADIEIGVQPEIQDMNGVLIKLSISDSDNIRYDDILLDNVFLEKAVPGPSIIIGSNATVHAINGAAFSIGVNNVHMEKHPIVEPDGYSDSEADFFDFDYAVSYDSGAINDREVLMFDSNNSNELNGHLLMYVNSDVDATPLYDVNVKAQRLRYSNIEDTYWYVTESFVSIPLGKTARATLNRRVPETTGTPGYARVHFEFPEEAAARSLPEMLEYDGRFVVFQQKIEERALEVYKEPYDDSSLGE